MLAFIIINISVTSFFSYFMLCTASSIIKNNYVESSDRTLSNVLKRIDMLLDKVEKYSVYITLDPEMVKVLSKDYGNNVNYPRLFAEQVENLTAIEPDILAVHYFSNDGDVFHFPPTISFNSIEQLNCDEFIDDESIEESSAMRWSGVYSQMYYKSSDRQETQNVFSGMRSFKRSFQPGIKGVLVLDISEMTLYEFIRNISFGDNSKIYIVDSSGRIMTSSEREEVSLNIDDSILKIIHDKESGASYTNLGKSKTLVVHNTSPKTGWKIIATIPLSDVLYQTGYIKAMALLVAVVVIIVSSTVSILISSKITKPLRGMTKLVKEVAKGNFDVRYEVRTNDEIKELSDGFNSMISNIKSLINKVYVEEIQLKQTQLENLQSKINPHFLYNTLDTIYWMLIIEKQHKIASLVVALSDMLRYNISNILDQVTIREEIRQIENYLFIQKTRFRDRLNVQYDIDESIVDCYILKLVIQPIVENAIKYGLECQSKNGTIIIKAFEENGGILLQVIDDGKGMDQNEIRNLLDSSNNPSLLKKPGIGIKNVNERLKMCYGERYGLSIQSKIGEGTCVSVFIPKVLQKGGEENVKNSSC